MAGPDMSFAGIPTALEVLHLLDADLDGASVRLELLYLGELHDGRADIGQALGRQLGASDVLDKGAEANARVLFCEAVGGCSHLVSKNARQ